jgi:hypothetical protein
MAAQEGDMHMRLAGPAAGVSVAVSLLIATFLVPTEGVAAGDTDGDGCPDANEQQTAGGTETTGGRRDYQNPWDYFNPSKDGLNRVDDVLLVLGQYFIDDDPATYGYEPYPPGYNTGTDRTLIGPNAWNLGPPNGQQRVDDILYIVNQYFHDCGTEKLAYAHSWYVTSINPAAMYLTGVLDGIFDNSRCNDALVVLDFGQPDYAAGSYGTNYFASGSPFVFNSNITSLAGEYARGWYNATSDCPTLKLVVGTNNYNFDELIGDGGNPTGAGDAWADVVRDVQNYLVNNSYAWKIEAWGGSDMEQPDLDATPPQDWDCAPRTIDFVNGYIGNPDARLFMNYGTAWVPNPAPPTPNPGSCWDAEDVWTVSCCLRERAFPEIYTGPASDSWVMVRQDYVMDFYGTMTDCPQADQLPTTTCITVEGEQFAPNAAQADLLFRLAAAGVPETSLDYATNIKRQGE